MRRYRLVLFVAALVLILLVIIPLVSSGISLLVDWQWFNHTGFREIYVTLLEGPSGIDRLLWNRVPAAGGPEPLGGARRFAPVELPRPRAHH